MKSRKGKVNPITFIMQLDYEKIMEKLKRYIDCYIPTETCNLRCKYCYITQKRKFNNKIACFRHSPEVIRKALSKERLGGVCLLNMCAGGETLLSDDILPLVKELLIEGHYIMIVTNGTVTKRFLELSSWKPEILERLCFKLSFHYLELLRLSMLEKFCNNIETIKLLGCSFSVEITPCDELIPEIPKIQEFLIERLGTLCHLTIARDDRTNGIDILSELSFDEYKRIWNSFDSQLFDFKTKIFYKKRKEFCYAGEWSAYLNLDTGDLRQCYCGKKIDNIYNNLSESIKFEAIGSNCTLPHCYNGHAFLTLGVIPELQTPSYAEVRDKVDNKGGHWLNLKVKDFYGQKLGENNNEYSFLKKLLINAKAKLGK